jgi:isopenicillin N synthase-like dioxygenase
LRNRNGFSRPADTKAALSIKRTGNNRGYVALGEERLDASKPGDVKEAFNIGWDLPADHPDVIAGKPFRGNVWPSEEQLPGFRATMLAYFDACHRLGMRLHRALAHDLCVAENFFDDKLDQPLATLRLLHYPPRPDRFEPGQTVRASTPITATSRCWRPTMPVDWKCVRGTGSGFRHRPSPAP